MIIADQIYQGTLATLLFSDWRRASLLQQQDFEIDVISLSNAKPQLILWDGVDACQSENPSQLIPKAPGISWFPASYIVYMWGRNSGRVLNLPRCYRPAKISPGVNCTEKNCWASLFQCLGSFSPSTLALVNIHTSKLRWRQMRFMAEHQDINHITQVIPERKNIFQINKNPTVYVREADVPSYGCACQKILIHPLELSICVFEVQTSWLYGGTDTQAGYVEEFAASCTNSELIVC